MNARLPLAAFLFALSLRAAPAQESAPLEEARKIVLRLESALGKISDAPLAIDADTEKPNLLKAGEGTGLMIVPDRKLSAASFTGAAGEVAPLGQLWIRTVLLAAEGRPVAAEKRRIVAVDDHGKTADVQLYLLGIGQAGGSPELVVYGKDKQPLLRVPLVELDGATQDLPVELSGRKSGEDTGVLTMKILGRYRAELTVMKGGQ